MRHGSITENIRLRLNAALYKPAPPRPPGTVRRPRTKGARLPRLFNVLADARTAGKGPSCQDGTEWASNPLRPTPGHQRGGTAVCRSCRSTGCRCAILTTASQRRPCSAQISNVNRCRSFPCSCRGWSVKVTFQEARVHLGVETQRQWPDKATARSTPCLLALFSIVTLLASRLPARERTGVTAATWYAKPKPTFVDALAAVRYALSREQASVLSCCQRHRPKRRLVLPSSCDYALYRAGRSVKVEL